MGYLLCVLTCADLIHKWIHLTSDGFLAVNLLVLRVSRLSIMIVFIVLFAGSAYAAGPGFGCNDTYLLQELHKCEKMMLDALINNASADCRTETQRLQNCSRRLIIDTCYGSLYVVYPKLKDALEQVMDVTLKQFNNAQFYCSEDQVSMKWDSIPTSIKSALPCHRRFFDESIQCAEQFRRHFVKNRKDPNLCSLYTQSKRCSFELSLRYCTNSSVLAVNKLNPFCPDGVDLEPRVVKPKYQGHMCVEYLCVNSSVGPVAKCQPKREIKCVGDPGSYLLPDGCLTARMRMRTPNGVVFFQELRNCTYSIGCDPKVICALANQTGLLTNCNATCCKGNLCNKDPDEQLMTTMGTPTATPTAGFTEERTTDEIGTAPTTPTAGFTEERTTDETGIASTAQPSMTGSPIATDAETEKRLIINPETTPTVITDTKISRTAAPTRTTETTTAKTGTKRATMSPTNAGRTTTQKATYSLESTTSEVKLTKQPKIPVSNLTITTEIAAPTKLTPPSSTELPAPTRDPAQPGKMTDEVTKPTEENAFLFSLNRKTFEMFIIHLLHYIGWSCVPLPSPHRGGVSSRTWFADVARFLRDFEKAVIDIIIDPMQSVGINIIIDAATLVATRLGRVEVKTREEGKVTKCSLDCCKSDLCNSQNLLTQPPTTVPTKETQGTVAKFEATEASTEPSTTTTEPARTEATATAAEAKTEEPEVATEKPSETTTEATKAATETTTEATKPETETTTEATKPATETTTIATKAATKATIVATEATKPATETTTEATIAATRRTTEATEVAKETTKATEAATETTEATKAATKTTTEETNAATKTTTEATNAATETQTTQQMQSVPSVITTVHTPRPTCPTQITKSRAWVRVTPAWVTQHKYHGVRVTYKTDQKSLVIQAKVTSYGCKSRPGSGLTTFIRGDWTRVMYTQEFRGNARCWRIFGDSSIRRGKTRFSSSGLEKFDPKQGDIIFNQLKMGGIQGDTFRGRTNVCSRSTSNFWSRANGEGLRQATVMLRRTPGAKDAGIHTATSCGTPSYVIKDIFVFI
ncbi:predicted protein [Nematostella vectensis]|uniref:Uncharacterized protein n=1 Tax=Nematostella vectensis TaxID=45351 RepID=A7RNV2_NEMVE|nr:predicted protein [Nematostella vectensis]|eukprot:XP_001638983.1 predicted protein [Nematostella vectensis]